MNRYENRGYGRDDDDRGYRRDYDRDDDRGFFERVGDEVRSWFREDDDRYEGRGEGRYAYGGGTYGSPYERGRYGDYNRGEFERGGYGRGGYDRGMGGPGMAYGRGGYERTRGGWRGGPDWERRGRGDYGGGTGERWGRERDDDRGRPAYDTGTDWNRGDERAWSRGSGEWNAGGRRDAGDRGRGFGRGDGFGAQSGWSGRGGYADMTGGASGYGGSYGGSDYGRRTGDRGRSGGTDVVYTYTEYLVGPMTGRGPQGYARNADRITEEVCDRLTDHGELDATNIRVTCENGEVTLEGTVSSRREKRVAEDVAESARGVRDVHNRLRVADEQGSTGTTATSGRTATAESGNGNGSRTGDNRPSGTRSEAAAGAPSGTTGNATKATS